LILTLLLPALEKIINSALKADPDAIAKIACLENQVIEINCDDWQMRFYIICGKQELQFEKKYHGAPNTIIKGTLNHFLHLFIKGADTQTAFHYPVDIEGDTHNIEILRNTFKNLDLDFEEKLSQLLGDTLAHRIFSKIKNTKKSLGNAGKKIIDQTKEYIYFEAKSLATRKQVEQFYNDIAKLRDDVERAEAKVNLIEESTK